MATTTKTIGRVPYNRGNWNAQTTYYKQNVVSHNGSSFIATVDSPSTEPTAEYTDGQWVVATGWQLLAYGGELSELTEDVAGMKSGATPPPLALNLKSWADRSNVEVTDEWDAVPVRTTAGDLSVNTAEGGHLISVKSQGDFRASGFSASPFNLINTDNLVGGVPYILVPACTFGTFGTADENNGILVTDAQGNNKKVAMRFKAYADGVPTSASDGIACPYRDVQGYRFFLPASAGYIWAADMTTSHCAHIAWSKDYDKYEAAGDFSLISFSTIMSQFTEIAGTRHMLAVNAAVGVADQFVYNGTNFAYTKYCGYDNTGWANTAVESGVYRHTKVINAMLEGGLARAYNDTVGLNVDGKTVWYEDNNATSNLAVIYQLATPVSGTVTLANAYQPNDMGCEYINDMVGDAIIVTTYFQGIPDELAALPSKTEMTREELKAEIKALRESLTKLGNLRVRNFTCDSIPNVTGVPLVLVGAGAPSEEVIPVGWNDNLPEWSGVPFFVGQLYIDTTNHTLYHADGDNAISDWHQ